MNVVLTDPRLGSRMWRDYSRAGDPLFNMPPDLRTNPKWCALHFRMLFEGRESARPIRFEGTVRVP